MGVFGLAVPITFYVSGTVLYLIFPALDDASSLYGAPYQLAFNVVSTFLLLLIPLSFGFAMLRSRLWDIDVLINRTLVYGAFTVSLALVYVGLIFGLNVATRFYQSKQQRGHRPLHASHRRPVSTATQQHPADYRPAILSQQVRCCKDVSSL